MNCTTNNYNIVDKENTESISSDGEFQEYKDCEEVSENNDILVRPKY